MSKYWINKYFFIIDEFKLNFGGRSNLNNEMNVSSDIYILYLHHASLFTFMHAN